MSGPASRTSLQWRYLWIFVATVGGTLLGPALHVHGRTPLALWGIILAIMIGSLRALRADRRLLGVVGFLGVLHLVAQIVEDFAHSTSVLAIADLTGMIFFSTISAGILMDIFQRDEITSDTVFGASAVFLLIGSFFTRVYMLLELLAPGSFVSTGGADQGTLAHMTRDPLLLGYYSLITLTTVGYGDILPARPFARSVASIEAVFGQLYIAAVIARLVALYTARPRGDRSRRDAP